jgi:hypothetical protein
MFLRTITLGVGLCAAIATAQDDSIFEKVQIHGALSQGFLFSSRNNYLTTDSSNGSLRWTEGMINFGVPLTNKLRAGLQLHSYSLGQLGQQKVSLDWAYGDYKFNDHLGIRAGRVKTPIGLFNDIQDIDALYPWVLLPQSVYPADMRSFHLAHTGFVVYGDLRLPRKAGSISWQGFAGSRSQDPDEGLVLILKEEGTVLGDASGPTVGGDIRWKPPVEGLILGASYEKSTLKAPAATRQGVLAPGEYKYTTEDFYAEFERGKLKLDAEWNIEPSWDRYGVPHYTYNPSRVWYVMGSWHFTDKLTAGMYYSQDFGFDTDNRDRHDPGNYSRGPVLNGRYDFNQHFYGKLEGHYVSGTANGFYPLNNLGGLANTSKLLAAKVGFTF